MKNHDPHDAATLTLAATWVGVCATCSWIGPERDTEGRAEADVKWHKLSSVGAETISHAQGPLPKRTTPGAPTGV